ncbi:TetR/AcrR family transcriptional regulator [Demequina salsinemoris]|uniref:TetR/AcrR family transcriptional regulator n=1 Tax=Demequina salsinemoris TaxID=577470 RepID=UPI00128C4084|nr:TetR/AcrR family transcriptional regulator [Demequina salsinemoris]
MTSTPINSRTRMSADERRRQIALKGAELVARYGSYGVSMQSVADAVGLTLPGLNHHVRSRDELLALIIETFYDDFTDEWELMAQLRRSSAPDAEGRLSLRACLNDVVEANSTRPELVGLFVRLAVEAHDPSHPAHQYYANRHQRLLTVMRALPWRLPPRFEDPAAFEDLLRTAFAAMDGTELQALTDPDETMADLWARADRVLFGGPEWESIG